MSIRYATTSSLDSIRPEGVAILVVQSKGFLNSLRHVYAKLVGPFEIAGSPLAN